MEEDFVEEHVAEPVRRDSEAGSRGDGVAHRKPPVDEDEGDEREHQGVGVVFLQTAPQGAVMIGMEKPAESVHDIFVHPPGDELPEHCHSEKYRQVDRDRCGSRH
jgi:hypothetical protein